MTCGWHAKLGWALLLIVGACRPSGGQREVKAEAPAGNPDASVVPSTDGGASGGGGPTLDTSQLTAPVQLPWVPNSDDPSCQHAEVVADCAGGWCQVPAGCFVMGSPVDEPGRAAHGETLTTVHLTHRFEIGQFEVTRAEWAKTGWRLPRGAPAIEVEAGNAACDESECPMTRVSWFAAMHYANWMSEHATPPLAPCYVLEACEGTTGNPAQCFSDDGCTDYTEYVMHCGRVTVNSTSGAVYDCEGYRLPTDAEWEYAARAGAQTAYLIGPMSTEAAADLARNTREPALDDYAWYRHNSPGSAQPVGKKGANAWGLYDVLGNVDEFVSNPEYESTDEAPASDPWGNVDATLQTAIRGGAHTGLPMLLRLARRLSSTKSGTVSAGFRLVRTIPSE